MNMTSWLDSINFNNRDNNDESGLLRIDFMSPGMECYHKNITQKEFESNNFTEKFIKNPTSIKYDGMQTVLNIAELEYEVDLDFKTVRKLELLSGKESILKVIKKDWREFLEAQTKNHVMIWGHNGMCGYTFKFSNVKKFDIKKLTLNVSTFDNGKDTKDYFLGGIQYDEADPFEIENTFEPKHGYWGPIFYKS